MALHDTTGAAAGRILDHAADGLTKLTSFWKDKPRVNAFASAFLKQYDDLETAFWDMFTLGLENSQNAQLDGEGALAGQPRRSGQSDTTYRNFIKARILANNSLGTLNDLYGIVLQLFSSATVSVRDFPPAAALVEVTSQISTVAEALDLFDLLKETSAAGVRLGLRYTLSTSATTFTFDTTPGGTDINQGFGSTTNATWGGDLASRVSNA